MKKINFLSFILLVLFVSSCGPAAEDRKAMHDRAKLFQDSIANVIRMTIAEAEGPPAPQPPAQAPAGNDTAAQRVNARPITPTK